MSIENGSGSCAPYKYEIDLAEYVRTHAETVLGRKLNDEEIEHVIDEYVSESGGIYECVYDSLREYAATLGDNSKDQPSSPQKDPCVICPSCEQQVRSQRLDFLKKLHEAMSTYYKVKEPDVVPFEVSIRIDGEVVEHINPDAFDLLRKS